MKATVLIVVVLTVIIFGGTTARMLEIVGVRTNVVRDDIDSDDEDFMDHNTDLDETWHSVRGSNGSVSVSRSIPLETSAAISRAGQPYPLKDKSTNPPPGSTSRFLDPFSVSDDENSNNESTASDLPPRAQSSPHAASPNRSNTGTPTGGRLARVGNIFRSNIG